MEQLVIVDHLLTKENIGKNSIFFKESFGRWEIMEWGEGERLAIVVPVLNDIEPIANAMIAYSKKQLTAVSTYPMIVLGRINDENGPGGWITVSPEEYEKMKERGEMVTMSNEQRRNEEQKVKEAGCYGDESSEEVARMNAELKNMSPREIVREGHRRNLAKRAYNEDVF